MSADKARPTPDDVRQILLNDWDPHDVARRPEAHGAYDVYIQPLIRLIESGADEQAIADFLKQREAETMCCPGLGTQRLRIVARKLVSLRPA
jgi:hypothetical protein